MAYSCYVYKLKEVLQMRSVKRIFVLLLILVGSLGISLSSWADEEEGYESYRTFVFSPQKLMWFAYENGELINSGRASGGSNYCRDLGHRCHTPVGIFQVFSKGSPDCRSTRFPLPYGGAPMPYCMFFRGGFAIHGSNEVPDYNASHGCIRVEPGAARWLSENFIRYGTRVVVNPY